MRRNYFPMLQKTLNFVVENFQRMWVPWHIWGVILQKLNDNFSEDFWTLPYLWAEEGLHCSEHNGKIFSSTTIWKNIKVCNWWAIEWFFFVTISKSWNMIGYKIGNRYSDDVESMHLHFSTHTYIWFGWLWPW